MTSTITYVMNQNNDIFSGVIVFFLAMLSIIWIFRKV